VRPFIWRLPSAYLARPPPRQVQFDNRWETAFGAFCANVADRLTAIAAASSAVTPEHLDHIAEAIVAATGDLFDDFEMARAAARAAIEAIAKDGRLRANLRCTMGELFRFLEDDLERGHSTKAG